MRKLLASGKGVRKKFQGIFSRFGKKSNYHGYSDETILLVQITDVETNKVVADHIWFGLTKGFEKLDLRPGMKVEFEARIKPYKKGYVNRRYNIDQSRMDFKLSNPTRVAVASNHQ
ncbi:MAG: hypothetical protein WD824_19500 [Cyclobacteriaceae bacterium]